MGTFSASKHKNINLANQRFSIRWTYFMYLSGKEAIQKGDGHFTFKADQSHFVWPLSKIFRLLFGAAGDIRCTSSPGGDAAAMHHSGSKLAKASQE